ncbi:hypothetical protein L2E82_02177 [Cichorium intybus]|uniref:Uncharacterized protein n=1 Tax=Cichorium intybus TaxID=13427 RepID=A0ACB9H0J9_CICIN|nr:hypothetical protein L2E82_02177 [Cichorium intybus]
MQNISASCNMSYQKVHGIKKLLTPLILLVKTTLDFLTENEKRDLENRMELQVLEQEEFQCEDEAFAEQTWKNRDALLLSIFQMDSLVFSLIILFCYVSGKPSSGDVVVKNYNISTTTAFGLRGSLRRRSSPATQIFEGFEIVYIRIAVEI